LPADARIKMPPPATTDVEGCESLKPPVIVRRLRPTVKVPFSPPTRPIVKHGSTACDPLDAADVPTSCTLLSIAMPPANVPGPSEITSPSPAASRAA
jgi:hypothetical protein